MEKSATFETPKGVRQGCIPSPILFPVLVDEATKNSKKKTNDIIGARKLEEE